MEVKGASASKLQESTGPGWRPGVKAPAGSRCHRGGWHRLPFLEVMAVGQGGLHNISFLLTNP